MKKYIKENLVLVLIWLWFIAITFLYLATSHSFNNANSLALLESDCKAISANFSWITKGECVEQMFKSRKEYIFLVFVGFLTIHGISKLKLVLLNLRESLNNLSKRRRIFLVASVLVMPLSLFVYERDVDLVEVETVVILIVQAFFVVLAFTNLSEWIDRKD